MEHRSLLTEKDHTNLDAFLAAALDDYRDGVITKEQAVSGLAHIIAALDQGNYGEVREWLEQGRKFLRG